MQSGNYFCQKKDWKDKISKGVDQVAFLVGYPFFPPKKLKKLVAFRQQTFWYFAKKTYFIYFGTDFRGVGESNDAPPPGSSLD